MAMVVIILLFGVVGVRSSLCQRTLPNVVLRFAGVRKWVPLVVSLCSIILIKELFTRKHPEVSGLDCWTVPLYLGSIAEGLCILRSV